MPSDIFLSYSREDRARVQPIADALSARGYDVWWDKGLHSGEDYRDCIEEMLKTARCVVVAWSAASLQSDFVMDEAGRAHRRNVLLPIFLDGGIEPPLGFGGLHTSDLSGWLDTRDDAALEQFAGDVERRVRPAAPERADTPRPHRRAATGGGWRRWVQMAGTGFAIIGLLFTVAVGQEIMNPTAEVESPPVAAGILGGPAASTVDPEPAAATADPQPAANSVAPTPVVSAEAEERGDGQLRRIIR